MMLEFTWMMLKILTGFVVLILVTTGIYYLVSGFSYFGMKIFSVKNKRDGFIDLLLACGLFFILCFGCHYLGEFIISLFN